MTFTEHVRYTKKVSFPEGRMMFKERRMAFTDGRKRHVGGSVPHESEGEGRGVGRRTDGEEAAHHVPHNGLVRVASPALRHA